MNIKQIVKKLSLELDSQEYAWWLLEAITNKPKYQLLFEAIELNQEQLNKMDDWVEKITKQHMPIQYLIGHVPFLNCEILVEPPILIPRPETEQWCAELIQKLKKLENKNIKILDMCTGSGCIAIAIAKALPQAHVIAVDISDKAIELTQKNIEFNSVINITTIKSDLFENLNNKKFDLIVSNPPYIDEALFKNLDLSVKNWEDPNALISTEGGLFLIKKIINQGPQFLQANKEFLENDIPQLVIEIDETQGIQVADLMKCSNFKDIKIKKDLSNKDRIVAAKI